MSEVLPTLIVGAGIAGMTAAHKLAKAGQSVVVLDKGRRPGGRMSTRVSRSGPTFDHGAQYLTARSVTFQQALQGWIDAGVAAEWDGRFVDLTEGETPTDTKRIAKRYVGTPGMSSVVGHLCDAAADVEAIDGPHFNVRVTELKKTDTGWTATDDAGKSHGPFSRVIVTIPAPQARELLAEPAPQLAASLGEAVVSPTWTLMLAFEKPLELWQPFDLGFIDAPDNECGSVANNSSKPGRPSVADAGECWVVHGDSAWSTQHVEDKPDAVAATLTAAFGRAIGRTLPTPTYAAAHRWRFANVVEPLGERWLYDADLGLGVCGDVCTAGSHTNIERAWLSALGLVEHMGG
ncbi:MAG: FAD-dependent oxidoreductase [Planctomycetota bacterium]